jgi:hypothetical protein
VKIAVLAFIGHYSNFRYRRNGLKPQLVCLSQVCALFLNRDVSCMN